MSKNTIVHIPGLVDVHVHMREPGGTHKEDFDTGTAAALAGGVTTVLCMPNTAPPIVDEESLDYALSLAQEKARCDYGLFIGATDDNMGLPKHVADRAAGLKIYVNDTFGPLRVESPLVIEEHIKHWNGIGPVALHAEGEWVPMLAEFAAQHEQPVHFCHVSRKDEIETIANAKRMGYPVTCEVAPHHLFLTQEDLAGLGPRGDMRPRLATQADQDALWANLDVVDCIATDHAPHTLEEKMSDKPPPGVPGLETMLPLMLSAVQDGRLTLQRMIDLTVHNPRRIFRLPAQRETFVKVEMSQEKTFMLPQDGEWETRAGWSPFSGKRMKNKLLSTTLRGEPVYEKGKLLAKKGSGRDIRKV